MFEYWNQQILLKRVPPLVNFVPSSKRLTDADVNGIKDDGTIPATSPSNQDTTSTSGIKVIISPNGYIEEKYKPSRKIITTDPLLNQNASLYHEFQIKSGSVSPWNTNFEITPSLSEERQLPMFSTTPLLDHKVFSHEPDKRTILKSVFVSAFEASSSITQKVNSSPFGSTTKFTRVKGYLFGSNAKGNQFKGPNTDNYSDDESGIGKKFEESGSTSYVETKDHSSSSLDGNSNYANLDDTSRYIQKRKRIMVFTRYPSVAFDQWPRMEETDSVTELDGSPCIDSEPFTSSLQPSCSLTYNTSQLTESDAVIFHEVMLPKVSTLRRIRRSVPHRQIWIWNLREPPYHLTTNLKRYNGLFNWTCTYSPESEVFDRIYHITPIGLSSTAVNTMHDFSGERTKMIFVAINNCFVKERLHLIRRLKKHIGIDVYGRCGKHVGDQHLPSCPRFTKKCSDIMRRYRFYFAMENSYCDYYVTEKYYENGLNSGLIPIVLGGADYTDSRFALERSFINVEDFPDLATLAIYLKQVAGQETLFNGYFWWRGKFKIHRKSKSCAVCKRLWGMSSDEGGVVSPVPNKTEQMILSTGQNLHQFWSVKKSCRNWATVIQKYI